MLGIVRQRIVRYYVTSGGRVPFLEWLEGLPDSATRHRAEARINRVRAGLMGDWKSVGGGVFEFRLDFGPGYRVYFGLDGDEILLLLCAGDKASQAGDIMKAHRYWRDYKERRYVKKA